MKTEPTEPARTIRTRGFQCFEDHRSCQVTEEDTEQYERPDYDLGALLRRLGFDVREAARALGVAPSIVQWLKVGRLRLVDCTWADVERELEAYAEQRARQTR